MEVQGSYMTSLLIPLAMVVVGHDSHPVQIITKSLHIIAWKLITVVTAFTAECLLHFYSLKHNTEWIFKQLPAGERNIKCLFFHKSSITFCISGNFPQFFVIKNFMLTSHSNNLSPHNIWGLRSGATEESSPLLCRWVSGPWRFLGLQCLHLRNQTFQEKWLDLLDTKEEGTCTKWDDATPHRTQILSLSPC